MSIEVEIGPMSQGEFRRLFRYAEAVGAGERAHWADIAERIKEILDPRK